ncbi:hypothetical protein EW146_g9847 [Bondarzewia mesenterica]|uniref:Uncharacterized protein n=1 Tax=Bondarzewia mesenterica TaxID=1095465 RepID=A0A4S4L2Q7_9AGAM|nr:hypothetical protein EW146_g9847 [Bondarzewia mesenterica]
MLASSSSTDHDDPLAAALRPPPDESPHMRDLRLAREDAARRVSKSIDDAIRQERQQNKKRKIVRVLLLGQSESGKSTTLRRESPLPPSPHVPAPAPHALPNADTAPKMSLLLGTRLFACTPLPTSAQRAGEGTHTSL